MRSDGPVLGRRSFLRTALIVPATGVAWAAAADRKEKVCGACQGTGRVACRVHTYTLRGKFRIVCSQCPVPECCGGLGWRPCRKCQPADVTAAWEAELDAWKAEAKHESGYPDKFGEAVERAAFRHFRMQGPFTHKQFHDYGEKIERCHAYVMALFGQDAQEALPWTRCQVGVFKDRMAYQQHIRQIGQQGAGQQHGWLESALRAVGMRQPQVPRTVTYRDGRPGRGRASDNDLQHSIIHALGHIYLETWTNRSMPPDWLGEGFGGHCEMVVLGVPNTYCIAYGGADDKGKGLWKTTLQGAIAADNLRPFDELARLKLSDMNGTDWAQSIAIVNLLTLKPDEFTRLVLAQKSGADAPAKVTELYGLTPKQLRSLWLKKFRQDARR